MNKFKSVAIACFKTANDLAQALSSDEASIRANAPDALEGINSVRFKLAGWLLLADNMIPRQTVAASLFQQGHGGRRIEFILTRASPIT